MAPITFRLARASAYRLHRRAWPRDGPALRALIDAADSDHDGNDDSPESAEAASSALDALARCAASSDGLNAVLTTVGQPFVTMLRRYVAPGAAFDDNSISATELAEATARRTGVDEAVVAVRRSCRSLSRSANAIECRAMCRQIAPLIAMLSLDIDRVLCTAMMRWGQSARGQ